MELVQACALAFSAHLQVEKERLQGSCMMLTSWDAGSRQPQSANTIQGRTYKAEDAPVDRLAETFSLAFSFFKCSENVAKKGLVIGSLSFFLHRNSCCDCFRTRGNDRAHLSTSQLSECGVTLVQSKQFELLSKLRRSQPELQGEADSTVPDHVILAIEFRECLPKLLNVRC